MAFHGYMGIFQDRCIADYYGARIEVEASATLAGSTFRLIVEHQKQDEISGLLGEFTLRGSVPKDGQVLPLQVIATAGLLGCDYRLFVNGHEHPIQRTK